MVWRKSRQNEWFKRGVEGKCRGREKITKIARGVMELWVHLPWVPWPLMAGDAVVTAVCMSHIQSPSHHHNHRCHFHHHHRCHHHCRFCHCHWPHHITPLNVFSSSMTSSTPSKCSHLRWNSGHSAADIATSILLSSTELSEGQKTSVSERKT